MLVSAVPTLLLRNIVVATDFTPTSEVALDYASAIAKRYSSRITLVHALTPVESAEVTKAKTSDALATAAARLRTEAGRCVDVQCDTRLVRGSALEVVEQVLALENVDLIVVGAHGKHGLRKFLVGSMAEQIFRHVQCPVLVIGPWVRVFADWEPKRILLATDLQSDETKTLEYAIALAAEHDAELALLHVTTPTAAPFPEEAELFLRPYFEGRLRRLLPYWLDLKHPVEFCVEFGSDPVTETIDLIKEQSVSLLVLSVHPGEPWTTHLHHDAYHMVTEAPCPVLVVQRRF
jgi:nucleotide-binding universal stress UspA family protein